MLNVVRALVIEHLDEQRGGDRANQHRDPKVAHDSEGQRGD